jgi:hypothetical protein
MISKNLAYPPTYSLVISAFVDQLKDGDTWYYNLTTDGNSNIGTILSKQYDTYDSAIYGMNERIRQLYSD